MAKKTEIIIETHKVFLVDEGESPVRTWCAECRAEIEMVNPDLAAHIASVDTRTIYRWVEGGLLHFSETTGRNLRVCMNSLGRRCSDVPSTKNSSGPDAASQTGNEQATS